MKVRMGEMGGGEEEGGEATEDASAGFWAKNLDWYINLLNRQELWLNK